MTFVSPSSRPHGFLPRLSIRSSTNEARIETIFEYTLIKIELLFRKRRAVAFRELQAPALGTLPKRPQDLGTY